jgi:peptidyl-dipeptidase Dcp
MNSYRKQYRFDGEMVTPVITTVFNFTKPAGNKPALISFDEASTIFHEFGHALHGLLSDCTYETLSGTAVARDFVELPSSIMENWCAEPEVIKMYGKHYKTGETIPDELIAKIKKAGQFNQGFTNLEYLSAAFLDMDYHTLSEPTDIDVTAFETKSLDKLGLIPEIIVRYRSTYFSHIFAGGYSAGYYSYKWSEVLDADAFEAFKETSLFDKETARSYRDNILARGGTEEPMELYKKFRGREPSTEALLKRDGLSKP